CIFDLLSLTIDDWGVESREVILQYCIPFASSLVKKLDFSIVAPSDIESSWNFFDRLIHLAIPDCKPSLLVSTAAYSLAQSALNVLRSALLSLSSSSVDYELKKEDVPLFARLVVIVHSIASSAAKDMDVAVAVYSQQAKRRKEDCVLDIITEWSFVDGVDYSNRPHFVVSCLALGCEITSRWSHRIEPHHFVHMGAQLWSMRLRIRFDWQLPLYCLILKNLITLGALDELCDPCSEACDMCSSDQAINHLQALGDDDDLTDTVCDVLSRAASSHGSALYELLIYLLTELEFDELKPFPGVGDKKKGIRQWKFRCHLAEWLITHSTFEGSVSEPLSVMCYLHPKRLAKSLPSILSGLGKSGIERDLELFGLSEKSTCLQTVTSSVPLLLVPELVQYVSEIYGEFWSNNGKKILFLIPSLYFVA
ncbi:unnamed protein product, partial [Strongylus vulgaris]